MRIQQHIMIHLLRIVLIVVLGAILMFLPFLPGDYDSSAITLSAIVQLFSIVSLLLVVPGIFWLIYEWKNKGSADSTKKRILFAKVCLYFSIPVMLITSLAGAINNSLSIVVIIAITSTLFIYKAFSGLRRNAKEGLSMVKTYPLYLVLIPLFLFLLRFALIEKAISFSRTRAIENAVSLINDIEAYKVRTGNYPVSLMSVWEDYQPRVRGIKRFYYELNGDAYNICFEQLSSQLSAKQVMMYNKFDQQEISSHNQDLLRLSPAGIAAQRGYFKRMDLPQKHWKYFLFD